MGCCSQPWAVLFYIFLFLLSSLAIGCYDDEGNYDYKTINEVAVKLEETYGVRKVDTVFVIRPEIRQSLATDTTNLKFEWPPHTLFRISV